MKTFKKYIAIFVTLCFMPAVTWAAGEIDINSPSIKVTVEKATYTGSTITPTVTVKDGENTLTSGTDYEITYKGSTLKDAKTYVEEIIIRGTGDNYMGTRYADFIISPKNIGLCSVEGNTADYTGDVIVPNIVVKDGETTLTMNTDYDITVSTAYTYKNPQSYANAITITGKGNYTGTKSVNFVIATGTSHNISDGKLLVTSNAIYTGEAQSPSASTVTVLYDNATLDAANYDLTFAPGSYINAQTYSGAITITGKGANYYGTVTADYVIAPRNMIDVKATEISVMAWTGSELTPKINADTENNIDLYYDKNSNGSKDAEDYVLKASAPVDYTYTVSPSPIKEAGTYIITFEGRGNFTGTKQLTVHVKKDISHSSVTYRIPLQLKTTTDGTTYTMPATFSMEVKDGEHTLTEGIDYTLTFSTDGGANYYLWGDENLSTNVGGYYVKVTGAGSSYTGTKEFLEYFVVNEYQTLGGVTYHITEPAYSQPAENGEVMIGAKTGTAIAVAATTNDVQTQLSNKQTTIQIGNYDFTFNVTGIEKEAFKECTALTTLTLPETITFIGDAAFSGCTGLRWIDLNTAENYSPINFSRDTQLNLNQTNPFSGLPRQTLVYLYGPTYSVENYVFKEGSTYTCDIFKIYDDVLGDQTNFKENNYYQADFKWAFQNEHNFTTNTLINTRHFYKGRHYTVCLPYSIAIPAGTKAYTFEKAGTNLLGFKEVTGTLAANTPYVLIPSVDGNLLNASNVQMNEFKTVDADAKVLASTVSGNYTFYGTMRYMEGADANGLYIMQYKDNKPNWLKISSIVTNDEPNPTKPCVLPMRAYIKNSSGGGARPRMAAKFVDIDGSTTTFDDLQLDADSPVYDLQGRRINTPSARGIYIRNGKKVGVK